MCRRPTSPRVVCTSAVPSFIVSTARSNETTLRRQQTARTHKNHSVLWFTLAGNIVKFTLVLLELRTEAAQIV